MADFSFLWRQTLGRSSDGSRNSAPACGKGNGSWFPAHSFSLVQFSLFSGPHLKHPQQVSWDQAEIRSNQFCLGFPCRWQGPKHRPFSDACPSALAGIWTKNRVAALGTVTVICDLGIASDCLTYCIRKPAPITPLFGLEHETQIWNLRLWSWNQNSTILF